MSIEPDNSSEQSIPLVRASVAAPVIAALRKVGVEPAFVLDPLGLNEAQVMDRQKFLPHDTVYRIYNAVADATSPDFCGKVGQSVDLIQFLPLGDMLAEALTLGDFLTRYTQAVSKESNAVTQSLFVEGDHTYFSAKRNFRVSTSPGQTDAFLSSIWVSLLHRVMDFRWDPSQIILRVSDPDALPRQFHGVHPIKCGHQGFSIRFPSSWLSHRLAPEVLENGPDLSISDDDLAAPQDFLAGLESLIRFHLADPGFGVDELASLCGFHRETLNNRLAPYGQSASQVIVSIKLSEAKKLLGEEHRTVSETALRLGYADPTAFSRAFRKWTGMSPAAFRKSAKENQ
ncbi:helix-turn-helix domain-containing protein [Tropicibacter sp. R16_0]|uniref:helix-turn-helix domain-containing protein n=1 Tax=Tropicibacter sp. R16_0 TaxID=2821102 RepID=UPI001AD9C1B2|nr:AraC family transcriptional regulator [Tropicibacter sp. R16_0]MBO9453041.1 helix-turn-helix domain-containing protein [Tropicibacter sp. R16_0]